MTKKHKYLLAFLVTILFSLGLFFFQVQLVHFKALGLLGLFLINIVGSLLIFPSPVVIASVLAAGTAYPIVLVALIASLGSSIGDIVAYFIGYSGRQAFVDTRRQRYEIIEEVFHKFGGLFIFSLALIPNPFFDAIGIIAGLFSYSPKRFFFYIFTGRLVRNLLLAALGSSL